MPTASAGRCSLNHCVGHCNLGASSAGDSMASRLSHICWNEDQGRQVESLQQLSCTRIVPTLRLGSVLEDSRDLEPKRKEMNEVVKWLQNVGLRARSRLNPNSRVDSAELAGFISACFL